MKTRFYIQLQSFSDIITNSSSELFVIENKEGKTAEQIKSLLEKVFVEQEDSCGGMGGSIDVKEFDIDKEIKTYIDDMFIYVCRESGRWEKSRWIPDYEMPEEKKKEIINYEKLREYVAERWKSRGIPEKGFSIDIDRDAHKTIDFIVEKLGGICD